MKQKKELKIIVQDKGGSGKSIVSFMVAEKYPQCGVLDGDDATQTTSAQLKYRTPKLVTFYNNNNMIDRAKLDEFFENISKGKFDMYVLDTGASLSEQIPFYLSEVIDFLPEVLEELGLNITFYCIVGGSNIFEPCMKYLTAMENVVSGRICLKVFYNAHFEFRDGQFQLLEDFCKDSNLELHPFSLISSRTPAAQERITEVLKSGLGLAAAPAFIRTYLEKNLKQFAG